MDVAVIADDLTGAADSGIQFARAGYGTAVAFYGAPIPPSEGLEAVAVDTDSRLLSPQEARERVLEAGRASADARIIYKKLDSTLRGPVAAELAAALQATGRSKAVVAPAFPSTGRSTLGGVQLLHGEPVHETGLADDPHTPVREGHIPSLLAEAGLEGVFSVSTEDLESPDVVRRVLENADSGWIVADAEKDGHLEALVRAVPDPGGVLWAGSAGLAQALGNVYPGPNKGAALDVRSHAAGRVLVVVGSTNEVVREQLRVVAGEPGVACVPLDSSVFAGRDPSGSIEAALKNAREALEEARNTALYTTVEGELDGDGARRFMAAIGEVVAGLSEEGLFDALVLTGGDTAVHVSRALGGEGILLEEEVEAGVPFGTLIGPKPYPVVTKAGGFGTPDTLLKALRTLTGKG